MNEKLTERVSTSPNLIDLPGGVAGKYARIEYGGLPVNYSIFFILLYPNMFR